jgi:hypothetical protein
MIFATGATGVKSNYIVEDKDDDYNDNNGINKTCINCPIPSDPKE